MLGQEAEQGKLDMEFSEEQEELRASLQRFLADRAPIAWVRALYDDPRGTTDDVWRGLADLSVLGVVAPEKYGGAGLGMVDACVVLEELGRAVHPSPYASSAIGAVSAIALSAASDQQNRWLPGLVNGDAIGTGALLDEGRRAEVRDPLATASSTGEGWGVSGGDAADVAEGHRAATMALAYATEQLPKIGADAVQAHGGIGFTWEHDIHLYFKRLLTLGQAGGGPATQLEELASIVLG